MAIQTAPEHAIQGVAPEATIEVRVSNGRLSGTVVAPEFEDLTHLERQRQVWRSICHDLGANAGQVGTLPLDSPVKAEAVEDDSE